MEIQSGEMTGGDDTRHRGRRREEETQKSTIKREKKMEKRKEELGKEVREKHRQKAENSGRRLEGEGEEDDVKENRRYKKEYGVSAR